MKLTMVASPPTPPNLRLLKQLGIDHAVHYDMGGLPDDPAALAAIRDTYARAGLAWRIAESGPAIGRIVLGKEGADDETRRWIRILPELGRLGVEVVAYNFMPQVGPDAMVVRTRTDAATRGGAATSAFRLADVRPETLPHAERAIGAERMWDNLQRFLRTVLPVAEAAGIRLAMHPDDPPLSPLCGLDRIMGDADDMERLLSLSPSPANALTLCVGCMAERGLDVPALVERFADRIAFVHVRDVRGTLDDFVETFPDDGQTDLPAVFRALARAGYGGYLRSDHAPRLATDEDRANDGYAMAGHVFAIGYLRGLQHAAFGRFAPVRDVPPSETQGD